jgi:CheY-like chemotaxis protein
VILDSGAPLVLLEDDPDDAYFVRRALAKAHIVNALLRFETAEQARRHFAGLAGSPLPALFIMDVNLAGGETGLDFLRWLRRQHAPLRSTPVMMVTGSDQPADREEAHSLGAVYFLHKPVTEDAFTTAVQSLGFVISSLTGLTTQRIIERRL